MRLKIIKDKQDKKDKERKGNEYEEVREKLIQMIGINVIHCSINMNKKKLFTLKDNVTSWAKLSSSWG